MLFYTLIEKKNLVDIKEYKNLQRNSTCLGPRQNSYLFYLCQIKLVWSAVGLDQLKFQKQCSFGSTSEF